MFLNNRLFILHLARSESKSAQHKATAVTDGGRFGSTGGTTGGFQSGRRAFSVRGGSVNGSDKTSKFSEADHVEQHNLRRCE